MSMLWRATYPESLQFTFIILTKIEYWNLAPNLCVEVSSCTFVVWPHSYWFTENYWQFSAVLFSKWSCVPLLLLRPHWNIVAYFGKLTKVSVEKQACTSQQKLMVLSNKCRWSSSSTAKGCFFSSSSCRWSAHAQRCGRVCVGSWAGGLMSPFRMHHTGRASTWRLNCVWCSWRIRRPSKHLPSSATVLECMPSTTRMASSAQVHWFIFTVESAWVQFYTDFSVTASGKTSTRSMSDA